MFVITDIGKLFLFFTYHDNHVIHGSRILFFLDYGSQKITRNPLTDGQLVIRNYKGVTLTVNKGFCSYMRMSLFSSN